MPRWRVTSAVALNIIRRVNFHDRNVATRLWRRYSRAMMSDKLSRRAKYDAISSYRRSKHQAMGVASEKDFRHAASSWVAALRSPRKIIRHLSYNADGANSAGPTSCARRRDCRRLAPRGVGATGGALSRDASWASRCRRPDAMAMRKSPRRRASSPLIIRRYLMLAILMITSMIRLG